MWNILGGILLILAGASGDYVLKGTESSSALIWVGVGFIVWGLIQLGRSN